MPKGSPFTRMCQLLGRPRHAGRVDMHLHTTASDGSYTPAQLLDISRRSGFSAIAVTDHDTIDGALLASRLRRVGDPVVIIGAELSITWHGRDLHLLAYGADPTHGGYCQGLADLRQRRAGRLVHAVEQLRARGLAVPDLDLPPVPGRRHLAMHMVEHGLAPSIQVAIRRWLLGGAGIRLEAFGMPLEQAVAMVRAAGGFTSLAHPPEWIDAAKTRELADAGVAAIEAEYPDFSQKRILQLKTNAAAAGLKVTGGSDCHGPGPRVPGTKSLELEQFLDLGWKPHQWGLHAEEKPCWEPFGKS